MAPMSDQITPDRPRIDDPDLRSDVRLLGYKFDQLDKKFDVLTGELKNSYATRGEVADVKEDVAGIKSQLTWVVRLVLGAMIMAVVALVIQKGGLPHL